MVAQLYKFLTQSVSDIHRAAYILATFALFSQLLALFRDRLLASTFGAGEILDVYYAAFRIPDIVYVTASSLVSLGALVPLLVHRMNQNKEDARRFLNNIFTFFLIGIGSISVVLFFAIPYISPILFPGLSAEATEKLVLLTRILLLQPIFLGLSSLFSSVTHVHKKFLVYAAGLLLYNVGIIFGLLFLYPTFGIMGLGAGVVLGAILQFAIQIPVMFQEGFAPRLTTSLRISELKEVFTLSFPRMLALSAGQIVMLVLISFASVMETGSITVFSFAYNLQSVPLTVIGVSYSVAAFPTLARLHSEGKLLPFVRQIALAARHIIFWSLPAMALFIVLRAQVVRVVFGAGEFGWVDTKLTAATLAAFALSIVAQALALLFIRGYYAAGKTRRPLVIALLSSLATIALALLFLFTFNNYPVVRFFIESLFRVEDVVGTTIIMLAFAFSLGQIMNALLLWFFFTRDFKAFAVPLKNAFVHSLSASVFMGFVSYLCLGIFDDVFNINTFFGIFMQGLLSGMIGIAAGVLLLNFLGNKEIAEVQNAIRLRIFGGRRTVIIPDDTPQR
jgi:putative peptidoglycan lipid II flippase